MLAGAMIQSTLLAGNSGGIALALDIEMGFTDRLLAAPISRFAIVLGRLAGTAVLGALTAVWFLAIGLIFGAQIEEGVPGARADRAARDVLGGRLRRDRRGDRAAQRQARRSVQGLFPLVFVILFLSTAFFPEDLLLEPARTVAEWNPLSFIVEGVRDPVISSFSPEPFFEGARGAGADRGCSGSASAPLALRGAAEERLTADEPPRRPGDGPAR